MRLFPLGLLLFLSGCQIERDAGPAPAAAPAAGDTTAEAAPLPPVTSVEELYVRAAGDSAGAGTTTPEGLLGRPVQIARALVAGLISDSALYIGEGPGRRVLVLLGGDEAAGEGSVAAGAPPPPADAADPATRLNVPDGATVRVRGTVARLAEARRGTSGLRGVDRQEVGRDAIYVRVARPADVEIAEDGGGGLFR